MHGPDQRPGYHPRLLLVRDRRLGGTVAKTRKSVLEQIPYFRPLLAGGWREEDVFLDMDPQVFGSILDSLRFKLPVEKCARPGVRGARARPAPSAPSARSR